MLLIRTLQRRRGGFRGLSDETDQNAYITCLQAAWLMGNNCFLSPVFVSFFFFSDTANMGMHRRFFYTFSPLLASGPYEWVPNQPLRGFTLRRKSRMSIGVQDGHFTDDMIDTVANLVQDAGQRSNAATRQEAFSFRRPHQT